MAIYPFKGKIPKIDNSCFIAPDATIVGDVTIGEESSVWYQVVIRGDVHWVQIGKQTNIQDGSILHVTRNKFPLKLHDYITIGHGVLLHGCTIHNYVLVGMGAIVLDNAVVEPESLIAAGTIIRENFIVPARHLVAGVPGKIIRPLTDEEIEKLHISATAYKHYAAEHKGIQPLEEDIF